MQNSLQTIRLDSFNFHYGWTIKTLLKINEKIHLEKKEHRIDLVHITEFSYPLKQDYHNWPALGTVSSLSHVEN